VLGEVNTPNQPTGDTEICQDAPNGTYNTSGNPTYVTSWIWDLSPTTAGTITPNGPIAVVNWSATFAGTASLKVKTSNLCGESAWSDAIGITIVPLPAAAGNVTGDEIVCQEQVQLYTVPVIADATNYEWSLEPSAAGMMNISANENTITWSDSWMGSAILKVRGVNDCGTGTWSADFEVLVQNCTGISTPDQNDVFTIFPNPGNGDFTVNATKNFDKEITISVVNMIGVEVFSKSFKSLSSGKSFGVNLVGLPGGIYYLKIETETGNFIQKILIHQ
jgi:hypothetical protein